MPAARLSVCRHLEKGVSRKKKQLEALSIPMCWAFWIEIGVVPYAVRDGHIVNLIPSLEFRQQKSLSRGWSQPTLLGPLSHPAPQLADFTAPRSAWRPSTRLRRARKPTSSPAKPGPSACLPLRGRRSPHLPSATRSMWATSILRSRALAVTRPDRRARHRAPAKDNANSRTGALHALRGRDLMERSGHN